MTPGTMAFQSPVKILSTARQPRPVERQAYETLAVSVDEARAIAWCRFRFDHRPVFSPALLRDLRQFREALRHEAHGRVRFVVYGSTLPGVFNLGGDLGLFVRLIEARDRALLTAYATACIDECWANYCAHDLPVVTLALVQGEALGGGFEAALSSNLIIAERGARFGLPELLFGLFPGMGAFSFLARKISPALAERMVTAGRLYDAQELHDLGVVDHLAEAGSGVAAVESFVDRHRHRHGALRAVQQARRRVNPLDYAELADIARLWVDTALELSRQDLRVMTRLIAAQDRRRPERPTTPAAAA